MVYVYNFLRPKPAMEWQLNLVGLSSSKLFLLAIPMFLLATPIHCYAASCIWIMDMFSSPAKRVFFCDKFLM
jgi:hypothetical protein